MNIQKALEVFVAVAEHHGIAPAARALNMSTSAVSRHLQELENWTGSQFFRRTTRSMSLTESGIEQLAKANQLLEALHAFREYDTDSDQKGLQGTIKLSAPLFVLRRMLVTPLANFQRSHPSMRLQILTSERFVDLVSEGYDLAFRIGDLRDSSLNARKLGDIKLQLVASPEYINRHGQPDCVADLKNHHCLLDTAPAYRAKWPIFDETAKRGVTVDGSMCVNNGEVIEQFALRGFGIGLLPEVLVVDHIKHKRLVRLLPNATHKAYGLYIVHPEMRITPPKVRAFVDFIADEKLFV